MKYVHSIAIPENQEEEYLVRAQNIGYLLDRKTPDPGILAKEQEEMVKAFADLTPKLQEKYHKQYDDLLQQTREVLPEPVDTFKP